MHHFRMRSNPFSLIGESLLMIPFEENGVLKNDPEETTEVFNNCYINIVETSSAKRPSSIGNPNSQCQDRTSVKKSLNFTKITPVLQP